MSDSSAIQRMFNRARIDDRQVNELIGLAHGLIADGKVSQAEAEHLQKWLTANAAVRENPVVLTLLRRVDEMLHDNFLDEDESRELLETLTSFTGGDLELGEVLKSTSLPLDAPPPPIDFYDTRFCFTGTFAFGSRRDCEGAVKELGATAGSLTLGTDYLVIGVYATDSWAHSSYGRKIEKAVQMRDDGRPVAIVGEQHWVGCL